MTTIQTVRFGEVEIDPAKLIRFSNGLVGLSDWKYYALIHPAPDGVCMWLQSTQAPDLAFVVCDPADFLPSYRPRLRRHDRADLRLQGGENAQLLVVCNRVDQDLTGNLQGPLAINTRLLLGKQLILSDRRFSTRHPLMRMDTVKEEVLAAKTA
jgi:flagellar assembly factor FliW